MPEPAQSGQLPLAAGGGVSWWRRGPWPPAALFLFAHGAGASSASVFMQAVGAGLEQRGVSVVHFDFPYMSRAHGRRPLPPDRPAVLLDSCQAMLDLARSWRAPAASVVGGKSMGGRMWSMLLAEARSPGVRGAVYFGYPLHPAGRPEKLRAAHLQQVSVPQLFVSGSRDSLARLDLLRDVVASVPRAELHVVDGGDHSLATQRRAPLAGSEAWLDVAARFILAHARG